MVKHIVMWNLKKENKEQNAAKIKLQLEALKSVIPEIITMQVGRNFNTAECAYDLILYSEFENEEGLDAYIQHPAHKEIAAFIATVRTARVVGDYAV